MPIYWDEEMHTLREMEIADFPNFILKQNPAFLIYPFFFINNYSIG